MENQTYFANLDKEQLGQEVTKRVTSFIQHCQGVGLESLWKELWLAYHAHQDGLSNRKIKTKGENGEIAKVISNHMRNILQQILIMTTSTRPAFLARAINDNSDSLEQASLAENIVQYFLREKNLDKKALYAGEGSLVLGRGFTYCNWDKKAGKPIAADPATGQIAYTGDFDMFNPSIYDVFYDVTKKDFDDLDWVIVRRWTSKFKLAKLYPEQAEKILVKDQGGDYAKSNFSATAEKAIVTSSEMTDDIEVLEFYHKPNILCPEGKRAIVLPDGIVLGEIESYENKSLPVFAISPGKFLDSHIGYAPSFDLLGLQTAYDNTFSSILTNIMMHGIQNVQVPVGTTIEHDDIVGGGRVFKVTQDGEVKGVNLLNISPEQKIFLDLIEKIMETTSGVNSVARGNIDASQRSGAALALVQSMALQFNSGFQTSYGKHLEEITTHMIRLVKENANSPMFIEIVGENDKPFLRSFTSEDLKFVDKVVVDLGNPELKTSQGRSQLADKLLTNGLVKTAEQYMTVYETGQLKPLYRSERSKAMRINSETTSLLKGMRVTLIPTDDHRLHILEHEALLGNPSVLNDPTKSSAIWEHIQEHMVQWKLMSIQQPDLLMALGQQPLAPTFGSNVPVAGQPGEGPQAPTQNMQPSQKQENNPNKGMPKNPASGEQVERPGGLGEE